MVAEETGIFVELEGDLVVAAYFKLICPTCQHLTENDVYAMEGDATDQNGDDVSSWEEGYSFIIDADEGHVASANVEFVCACCYRKQRFNDFTLI